MKRLLLLPPVLLGATLAAHAQVLPVPNARNPDWEQVAMKPGLRPSRPDSLPARGDRMPIVDPSRQRTDRMPNALTKSLTKTGNTYHYWDAARRLAYEWRARPGSGTAAPDSLVTVQQQATGATFTFRRRPTPAAPSVITPN